MTNTDATPRIAPDSQASNGPSTATAGLYDPPYRPTRGPGSESGKVISSTYPGAEPQGEDSLGDMAESIIGQLRPQTVLDAGCTTGFLVEELRSRGVDARGIVATASALEDVPVEVRPFCRVGRITEEIEGSYDLIVCVEVLGHLPGHEAEEAIANMCRHSDVILFSSSPDDFENPTQMSVQPSEFWIGLFAAQGFFRSLDLDVSYVAPHAVVVERRQWTMVDLAKAYERAWWQAQRTAEGARASRQRLKDVVDVALPELETAKTEKARLADQLAVASAEGDRLTSLLAIERAISDSELAQARAATDNAERELDALRQTKVLRYTADIRRAYGMARRLMHGVRRHR
jgi:SAM-dependent methyltransferase